jgi:hypothetical protein
MELLKVENDRRNVSDYLAVKLRRIRGILKEKLEEFEILRLLVELTLGKFSRN